MTKPEKRRDSIYESQQMMTFNFSESQTKIRNVFVDGEPYFIGSDLAKALGYKNTREALKQHCRYVVKCYIPHPQSKNKTLTVLVIPESDMYRLVINSQLSSAQTFEKWVMEDVLPSIRKKGHYIAPETKHDYLDARDIPYAQTLYNNTPVRSIVVDGEQYYSVNDIYRAIGSRTDSSQTARQLNKKQTLAVKIWLFGNTHPAWFTTQAGFRLIVCSSKIAQSQPALPTFTEGGAS